MHVLQKTRLAFLLYERNGGAQVMYRGFCKLGLGSTMGQQAIDPWQGDQCRYITQAAKHLNHSELIPSILASNLL